MFEVVAWFGSPFAGQVCDDGPIVNIGLFATMEEAKEALRAFCGSSQCLTYLVEDGMEADFCNWNSSTTGGAKIRQVPS